MQLFRNILRISVGVILPCAHLIADEVPFRSVDATAPALVRDLDDALIKAIINNKR